MKHWKRRIGWGVAVIAAAGGIAPPAWSSPSPYGAPTVVISNQIASPHEPVVLQSDQLDYDREHELAIATGHVEVTQGDSVLLADTLTYDHANDTVFAQGHVSVLEPSGNVYFADEVELEDAMERGVAEKFRARFSDNSLLAANKAERQSEAITKLYKAVYSPCLVTCPDGSPKTPQWQIAAGTATLDRDKEKVTYHNAFMEAYGIPILYTPYMSHPTPGAENESGLLVPEFRQDSNLGSLLSVPVYWAIAPDKDMTLTPVYSSRVASVLIGEYRERFDDGRLKLDGSITDPNAVDNQGNPRPGQTIRGHIFASGDFGLNSDWRAGFDVRRTTDDTYLRLYGLNNDPVLTSRIYGEGFGFAGDPTRSYAVVESLAFQGLQAQDDPRQSPLLAPVMNIHYESLPLAYNSRLTLTGGIMSLTRGDGQDSRRLSAAGDWTLPYVTDGGHVFSFSTKLRADGYDVSDVALPNGSNFTGVDARVMPEARLDWRYPLMKQLGSSSLIVEPVVDAIVSTTSGNTRRIPNEDSATPEFTDANLFSDDRFAGYDRVETGPRMAYGLRSQLQMPHDFLASGLLGQAYRMNSDSLFPLSGDPTSHFSDYVGRLSLTYGQWFDMAYRYRLNKDSLALRRSEFNTAFHVAPVTIAVNYLEIDKDAVLPDNQQVTGSIAYDLASSWTLNASATEDVQRHALVGAAGGIIYHNECMTVNTSLNRDLTSDRDYQQSTSVRVEMFLKNLN